MPALATGAIFLVVSSFLASTVEMVEALTIVLAVCVSRQWRSTLIGVGVALGALAVVVAALGPALALTPLTRYAAGLRNRQLPPTVRTSSTALAKSGLVPVAVLR
jgi:hypothetical protein